jgi:hydrogenase maturation factor
MIFSNGKIPNPVVNKLISKFHNKDPRVLLGPQVGEDTAHISFGSKTLILTSDPITFVDENIEKYSLQINANDIATSGALPKWFLATVLFSENTSEDSIYKTFKRLNEAANQINVTIVGGHTEITKGLSQTIICGTMIGEIEASRAIKTSDANIGDDILLYGFIGIEGTSILAENYSEKLSSLQINQSVINNAKKLIKNPGISIVEPAIIASSTNLVTSMHDVTEGGISTALNEIANASKKGILVHKNKIPILKETQEICSKLKLDPLGLISSGALLITTSKNNSFKLIEKLKKEGFELKKIGEVTNDSEILFIDENGDKIPVKNFYKDEIVKFFESD